jgi:hypothetical protein
MGLAQVGGGKGAALALMRADGELKTLRKLNPFLDGIAETRWTDFVYPNAEGSKRVQLSGCLLLPADYHSGKKYPLIVEVYPDRPGGCGAPEESQRTPPPTGKLYWRPVVFISFRPDTGGSAQPGRLNAASRPCPARRGRRACRGLR